MPKNYHLNRKPKGGRIIAIALALAITLSACGQESKVNEDYFSPNSPYSENENVKNDYIDTLIYDEFRTYNQASEDIPISITADDANTLYKYIKNNTPPFSYSQYYGFDEVLSKYNQTKVNKSLESDLLNENGQLDTQKLINRVKKNNQELMSGGVNSINTFYTEIDNADLTYICTLITEVANDVLSGDDLKELANTLTKLTVFVRTGSASLAYVSDDITLVYNPTMSKNYENIQKIQGNTTEDYLRAILEHEIFHLLQYASNDLDATNGNEVGFCRKYNDEKNKNIVPVDSLWFSWALEAGAEISKAYHMNINPTLYAKRISYSRSFNLSRFGKLDTAEDKLESIIFTPTLEKAYENLNYTTEEEKRDFLNFMYSVEITQTNPDEFWTNYKTITKITPTEEEQNKIRMQIRADAVNYMTVGYYTNIVQNLENGNINDLNTLFYLMRVWELDTYGHLEYTKTECVEAAVRFIVLQHELQQQLFETIAKNNNLNKEDIELLYNDYTLTYENEDGELVDNCDLTSFSKHQAYYLATATDNLTTSSFTRGENVYDYILSNFNTEETSTESSYETETTTYDNELEHLMTITLPTSKSK